MLTDDIVHQLDRRGHRLSQWRAVMNACHIAATAHGLSEYDAETCVVESPHGCPDCPLRSELPGLTALIHGARERRRR